MFVQFLLLSGSFYCFSGCLVLGVARPVMFGLLILLRAVLSRVSISIVLVNTSHQLLCIHVYPYGVVFCCCDRKLNWSLNLKHPKQDIPKSNRKNPKEATTSNNPTMRVNHANQSTRHANQPVKSPTCEKSWNEKGWGETVHRTVPLIKKMDSRILVPLPWSPVS